MSIDFTSHFGDLREPYTAIVTLVDMVLFVVLAFNVGRARVRYNVEAPSTDGPAEFRRRYRVQMNTIEQAVIHLPLLWLAALSVSDPFAAAVGIIWPIGRISFARGYYKEPKARSAGFSLGLLSNLVLFIGVLAGIVAAL